MHFSSEKSLGVGNPTEHYEPREWKKYCSSINVGEKLKATSLKFTFARYQRTVLQVHIPIQTILQVSRIIFTVATLIYAKLFESSFSINEFTSTATSRH